MRKTDNLDANYQILAGQIMKNDAKFCQFEKLSIYLKPIIKT